MGAEELAAGSGFSWDFRREAMKMVPITRFTMQNRIIGVNKLVMESTRRRAASMAVVRRRLTGGEERVEWLGTCDVS